MILIDFALFSRGYPVLGPRPLILIVLEAAQHVGHWNHWDLDRPDT